MSAQRLDAIDFQENGEHAALTSTAIAVIPYQEPAPKGDNIEFGSTISSTLPMAAIFMRNKYIGW